MIPKLYQIWHLIYRWLLKNNKWENISVWSLMPILHLFCMYFQGHYWTGKQRELQRLKFLASTAGQNLILLQERNGMHKKNTKNSSTLELPTKDLNLERVRFKVSLYLKKNLNLSCPYSSQVSQVSDSRVNLTFRPEAPMMILCRTETQWQTLSFHLHIEDSISAILSPSTTTVRPWLEKEDFVI